MDFKERYLPLFQTSVRILINPGRFWKEQEGAERSRKLFIDFFLPLVLLVGVAIFFGELMGSKEFLISYAVAKSMREVISYILLYVFSIFLLNELLSGFGAVKNKNAVRKLVGYSLLPFLIVSFLTGLCPALYALNILNLYGIFIFIVGAKESLGIPAENQTKYIMIAFLLVFLIFILLNVFSWKLLQAFYGYGV